MKDPEKVKAYNKAYYASNTEREKARANKWSRENREHRNEMRRVRNANDPEARRKENESVEKWKRENPDKWRAMRDGIELRQRCKRRGITTEQYLAMLEAQRGACKICRRDTVGTRNQWHIDHNHITGAVRGLLCHHCNAALGHVRDNASILQRMIDYLKGD